MIDSVWQAVKVDIRDKSRNPFIGAFIIVWIIRHWEAFYTFFFFDDGDERLERITILKDYFTLPWILDFLITVGISITLIFVTYFFSNLTLAIVTFFDKRIRPQILKFIDFQSVVPKSDFDIMVNENIDLQQKISSLKTERAELRGEIDELEKRVSSIPAEINSNHSTNTSPVISEEAKRLFEKVNDKEKKSIIELFKEIFSDRPLSSESDIVGSALYNELIKPTSRKGSLGHQKFELTEIGKEFKKLLDESSDIDNGESNFSIDNQTKRVLSSLSKENDIDLIQSIFKTIEKKQSLSPSHLLVRKMEKEGFIIKSYEGSGSDYHYQITPDGYDFYDKIMNIDSSN
ncbi:hypothetical protein DN752_21000 [Echinicola strongylocentroti]|uniref:Uncharacterized protein n=1 Tax=Echinicola strongylocentroti TaxID=1795355 RepID=A0A2Z4IMT3_9BACT|nr:hypothetical protein [Echinicola strongylocentroti]AWW32421.1 hypothetical protein DN752_21000 [Echinicola strongylocentroti]